MVTYKQSFGQKIWKEGSKVDCKKKIKGKAIPVTGHGGP
jgi:hypothetical protein